MRHHKPWNDNLPNVIFLQFALDFDGGVSITASHNPKEYNGVKLAGRAAHSICGEELQEILRMTQAGTVPGDSFGNSTH